MKYHCQVKPSAYKWERFLLASGIIPQQQQQQPKEKKEKEKRERERGRKNNLHILYRKERLFNILINWT